MWVPAPEGGGGIFDGYEALLALDEKIEKVGLLPDEISKFPLVSVKGCWDGVHDSCSICLEDFKKGQKGETAPVLPHLPFALYFEMVQRTCGVSAVSI